LRAALRASRVPTSVRSGDETRGAGQVVGEQSLGEGQRWQVRGEGGEERKRREPRVGSRTRVRRSEAVEFGDATVIGDVSVAAKCSVSPPVICYKKKGGRGERSDRRVRGEREGLTIGDSGRNSDGVAVALVARSNRRTGTSIIQRRWVYVREGDKLCCA